MMNSLGQEQSADQFTEVQSPKPIDTIQSPTIEPASLLKTAEPLASRSRLSKQDLISKYNDIMEKNGMDFAKTQPISSQILRSKQ